MPSWRNRTVLCEHLAHAPESAGQGALKSTPQQTVTTTTDAGQVDPSGLEPHTEPWLQFWDRQIYEHALAPKKWPAVLFSVEAVRAVMQYSDNPASLFGSIPED